MKEIPIKLEIPKIGGGQLSLELENGDQLFVVGPNGSGKSVLFLRWNSLDRTGKVKGIAADRRVRQNSAIWRSHLASKKQDIPALLERINELFEESALAVSMEYAQDGEVAPRRRNSGQTFDIARMSDGETDAFLIAVEVLTAKPGTVLLIDEPERHLHRSVIRPFLSALLECRDDCAFVVSTHDVDLPVANPDARVLMVGSCEWEGNEPGAWDVKLLEPNGGLPDDLNLAILGAREKILFVEGGAGSLDLPLYGALFPNLLVVPKGGFRDVQEAVKGLRASCELHRVEAYGLIDRDNRDEEKVRKLEEDGVFALEVVSAEALYYCSHSIAAVAAGRAESLGRGADELIRSAKEKALGSIGEDGVAEEMAARKCEGRARDEALSRLGWKRIMENPASEICIKVGSGYEEELCRFNELVDEGKLDDLVARYPLRKSGAFDAIAKALECSGRKEYERTVLSMVQKDRCLSQAIRKRIGPLADRLGAGAV